MRTFLITALLIILVNPVFGQDDKINVIVKVFGSDNIEAQTTSYIKRELRALGDVNIIADTTNSTYLLSVGILNTKSKSGQSTGYAASIMIAVFGDQYSSFNDLYKSWVDNGEISRYEIVGALHTLEVGSDLKILCESIVAYFDVDYLESERELQRKLIRAEEVIDSLLNETKK